MRGETAEVDRDVWSGYKSRRAAREQSSLAPAVAAISELAGRMAGEVERLAETLKEAVGRPPGIEEG